MSTHATARAMLFALASVAASAVAHATPSLVAAARALPATSRPTLLGPAADGAADVLFVRSGSALAWARLPFAALDGLAGGSAEVSVGSMRWPLLDRSAAEIHATAVRARDGLTGRGIAIAVIDTGLDVRHADFRRADGTTRVAWLLDFSRPARGVHADLESRFGMPGPNGTLAGAVYDAAELDALLEQEIRTGRHLDTIPIDDVGHGTYVASIAAGNGRATGNGFPAGRYVGIAPDADLLVVRANPTGTDRLSDADIVAGVAFAADRAQAMSEPLVVNLSIGSQFGTHDGGSALERALAMLVPADAAGRAVVVAAGNDGEEPVHARLDLTRGAAAEFPVDLGPAPNSDEVIAVQIVYEQAASIAVRFPDGITTAWVDAGTARGFATGDGVASIANATDESARTDATRSLDPAAPVHSAVVVFTGDAERQRLRAGGRWTIRVEGEGPVHAYLANAGGSLPAAHLSGPTLRYGAVAVPATSPAVVAVGSLTTRLDWVDAMGDSIMASAAAGTAGVASLGEVSAFSARGPNRLNEPRPDVLAPGEWVLAAMSAQATPDQRNSIFARPVRGILGGLVADDGAHAAARGTSGAAPHVTGAIALLLEAFPRATQGEMRAALASTARGSAWDRANGWGEVTVDAALDALRGMMASDAVDPARSEVSLTMDHVAQGEPLSVMVRLRDAAGVAVAADGVLPVVTASAGTLESLRGDGAGIFEARWRADGTAASVGGVEFAVRVGAVTLLARPAVRVVRSVANGDAGATAGNGCGVARRASSGWLAWVAGVLLIAASRRRRG